MRIGWGGNGWGYTTTYVSSDMTIRQPTVRFDPVYRECCYCGRITWDARRELCAGCSAPLPEVTHGEG